MVVILYFGEIQTSLSLDSGKRYLSLKIIEKKLLIRASLQRRDYEPSRMECELNGPCCDVYFHNAV